MTIIVYSKGQLAADSRGLQTTGLSGEDDFFITHDVVKLKLLARNTLAVAVCGSVPTKAQWLTIEDVLLRCIITTELLLKESVTYLTDKEAEQIRAGRRHFIVMSKKHTYYISPESKDKLTAFSKIDYDTPIAQGTGARVAYMALRLGKTAEQAAQASVNVDHACGGPILSVLQDSLVEITDFTLSKLEKIKIFEKYIKDMDADINSKKKTI